MRTNGTFDLHRLPLKVLSRAFEMIGQYGPAVRKVIILPNG